MFIWLDYATRPLIALNLRKNELDAAETTVNVTNERTMKKKHLFSKFLFRRWKERIYEARLETRETTIKPPYE